MAIYKLSDVCSYTEGYVNPPINEEKYFGENVISWMKVNDLKHATYITKTKNSLSKHGFNLIKKGNQIFKKGTIVWSKSGSVGNCAILNIEVCANRGVLNIIPNNKIMNKYLFYYLIKNKNYFSKNATGAVLRHFYGPHLMKTRIELPSLVEQQKIIDIIEPIENGIDILNRIIKQTKSILKNNYMSLNTKHVSIKKKIKLVSKKYENQKSYFATNAIGEFEIHEEKKQDISFFRPSRANLSPLENSIIFSKLLGENKVVYFNDKPLEVYSTGFFNITTNCIDHIIGFILSTEFKKQKSLFSSGTTMIALNNNTLSKMIIKNNVNENNVLSIYLTKILKIKSVLQNLQNNLIKILIK